MEFTPDDRDWVRVDKFRRYQVALSTVNLFPKRNDGLCACGCNNPVPKGKRRWYSLECNQKALTLFMIVKGDTKFIRQELLKRDFGACRMCGLISDDWQADHIIPVHKGGGACGLDNFQTLCKSCHAEKTKEDLKK
jgi:5-methylcytosine-specific restriction endonuclease McrA